MKTRHNKKPKNKRSVSFPSDLMAAAEVRAAQQGRKFSNYIQNLVRKDSATLEQEVKAA